MNGGKQKQQLPKHRWVCIKQLSFHKHFLVYSPTSSLLLHSKFACVGGGGGASFQMPAEEP